MRQAPHWNGNLLCAIDCETTGLVPGFHDLVQICIMPVAPDLKPNKDIPFFHMKLIPQYYERIQTELPDVTKRIIVDAKLNGTDPWTAIDRLTEWFYKLNLPEKKKIIPLGFNFGFDSAFILNWLGGYASYGEFFRSDHRDVMTSALFLNDIADWFTEPVPFPKFNLAYVAAKLGVEHSNEKAHDAVMDCLTTIECYRRMMRFKDFCQFCPSTESPQLAQPIDISLESKSNGVK